MAADPLEVMKLKLKRADEHVLELHKLIQSFHESGVYEMTSNSTIDAHEWITIEQTKEIPGIISVVVGETVYQLRSILDHLACALARQHGGRDEGVYFPFAGDREKFDAPCTQRKIARLAPDAIALIKQLKPYKGGNDFLWSLSRIANVDKHRTNIGAEVFGCSFAADMKVTLPAGTNHFVFRPPLIPEATVEQRGFSFRFHDRIRTTLHKKVPLMGFPIGAHGEGNAEIAFDVAFGDVDVVRGHPVFTTMQQYVDLVRNICIAFDSRFFASRTAAP